MSEEIILDTVEYEIVFLMEENRFPHQVVMTIIMTSKSPVDSLVIESMETTVQKEHIVYLCKHMQKHVNEIKKGNKEGLEGYLDYDMLFWFTPHVGEYFAEEDTVYFSASFFVNTGTHRKTIWTGGKISLDTDIVWQFNIDMRDALLRMKRTNN